MNDFYYYLYIFLESFIFNAIPVLGPSITILALPALIKIGISIWHILLTSFILSLGTVTGKYIIYYIGVLLSKPLSKNKNVIFIEKISKKKSFPFIFIIISSIPLLPLDDLIIMSLGASKVSVYFIFLIIFISRFIRSSVELFIGIKALEKVTSFIGIDMFLLSIYSSIASIIFSILFFKIDWGKYFNKYVKND